MREASFSSDELHIFAQKLNLEKFYENLQKRKIEKKRLPEELLKEWAAENESTESKKNVLSYLFSSTGSEKFQKIQSDFQTNYRSLSSLRSLPSFLSCCTDPSTLSPLCSPTDEAACVREKTNKRKTLLVHVNLDAVTAEKMLENNDVGTYILRYASDNKSLAVSVKGISAIEHFKEDNFDQLLALVDRCKDKFITLLPPDVVAGVFGPRFVKKFLEEMDGKSVTGKLELITCLGLEEKWEELKATPMDLNKCGNWILKAWIESKEGNTKDVFMQTLNQCNVGKQFIEELVII